jgi:hypothetical protein
MSKVKLSQAKTSFKKFELGLIENTASKLSQA